MIARYITLPMPVPGATIRAMAGDPGRLSALVSAAVPGAGMAVLPGELPGRVREELPVIAAGEAGSRSWCRAWVTGLRSAHTRPRLRRAWRAWLG